MEARLRPLARAEILERLLGLEYGKGRQVRYAAGVSGHGDLHVPALAPVRRPAVAEDPVILAGLLVVAVPAIQGRFIRWVDSCTG